MSKQKNVRAFGMDPPDGATDPLDDLVVKMLLTNDMDSLPDLDNVHLEQLANHLTKKDLEALDWLESPEKLVEAITTTGCRTGLSADQVALETSRKNDETIGEPGSPFYVVRHTEEFDQMMKDVDAFDKQERLHFQAAYRKKTKLGQGGQGIVYLVEGEDDFSAAFALKVFLPHESDNLSDFVADMKHMQRIASLIHHKPHDDLVDIGWFGQRNGVYTMLMQHIDGFDLRRLLQPQLLQLLKQGVEKKRWDVINNVVYSMNGFQQLALQPAIAVYIIERVLRGLAALHSRDIVHGDIKPSNIMLNASGSVKIIDIGSAFEGNLPSKRHHFTPAYAAPEFLKTETMSKQSDLASVGYMLIELLSGKPITDRLPDPDQSTRSIGADLTQELLRAKQALPDRLPEILPRNILASNHLVELCRCLIDPDLNRRFPTASESIVDRKGTYAFNTDLILAGLGVCNYHEVSQWLADVKQAMGLPREDLWLPR